VTYRDDHDAALARAESLEAELANVERERDRLRSELERAKHAPPPPLAPEPARPEPVRVQSGPLAQDEIERLLSELETGARSVGNDLGAMLVIAMICAMLAIFGIAGQSVFVAVGGFALATIFLLGALISRSARPEDWLPVLEAVRDHPDRINSVREQGRKYGALIVIETSGHEMRVYTTESAAVLALLARRCKHARFENA